MRESRSRYSTVSIFLHWAIFVLIFANANLGGRMEEAELAADAGYWFQWHRAVGLTILGLSLIRLVWRFTHPWPPLPERMPEWEKRLARGTHIMFYVLMIGAPLMGLAAATVADNGLGEQLGDIHKLLVKAIYVVLALHVAGALKHHFIDKDEVLSRMLPIAKRRG